MERGVGVVWIPEAPGHPGLYANEIELERGKLSRGTAVFTAIALFARQFATREECAAWCAANPAPPFVPVEHGFADGPQVLQAH